MRGAPPFACTMPAGGSVSLVARMLSVFSYYIECPILWLFATETLTIQEDSVSLGSRLCIVSPSLCQRRLLAFVHTLYHALRNEPRAVSSDGFLVSPKSMQSFTTEISRSLKSYIPGGHR